MPFPHRAPHDATAPVVPGRRRCLGLVASLGAASLVSACNPGTVVMSTAPGAEPVDTVSLAQAQPAINAIRAEQGLPLMAPDSRLQAVAEEQAALMAQAGEIGHAVTRDDRFTARLRRNGYAGPGAENLAGGQPDLASVLESWMRSRAHRRNMLNPQYTRFGIATMRGPSVAANTYGTYWALVLGVALPEAQNATREPVAFV